MFRHACNPYRMLAVIAVVAVSVAGEVTSTAEARPQYVCPSRLVTFVDALSEIDGSLTVGLNYSEFSALLRRASVA